MKPDKKETASPDSFSPNESAGKHLEQKNDK